MVLSYIWVGFICIAFLGGLYRYFVQGDMLIFQTMVNELFSNSKVAVMDIALPLVGVMAFWLGLMKIAEQAGLVQKFSRVLYPLFSNLFPDIPKNHPSVGHMTMNFSANLLGLDNAATPFGLRAMQSLQEINPQTTVASRSQIMFILLHASGLTLIPVTVMAQRAIYGANNPSDVFIPIAISTTFTTLVSLSITAIWQKIRFRLSFVLGLLACMLVLSGMVLGIYLLTHQRAMAMQDFLQQLPPIEQLQTWTVTTWERSLPNIAHYTKGMTYPLNAIQIETLLRQYTNDYQNHPNLLMSNFLLLLIPVSLVMYGLKKKRNVFEDFVDGAKESFDISLKIIPYLVGMLVAIGLLRSAGIIDILVAMIEQCIAFFNGDTAFVPSLSTALMKPLSGSAARSMMIETMKTYGADSFVGRLSCIFQGTSDTILYIVALYFGSVGITKTGYTVLIGLGIDLIGLVGAVMVGYLFFA